MGPLETVGPPKQHMEVVKNFGTLNKLWETYGKKPKTMVPPKKLGDSKNHGIPKKTSWTPKLQLSRIF